MEVRLAAALSQGRHILTISLLGPQTVVTQFDRLDTQDVKDAVRNLVDALTNAATKDHSGASGGRFSQAETQKLSALSDVLSDVTEALSTNVGSEWGHDVGAIRRRMAPGVFLSRLPTKWNNWQTALKAIHAALNIHSQYCLLVLLCCLTRC